MNLLLLFQDDRIDEYTYQINDHRSEHLIKILKVEPGTLIQVGLVNGCAGNGEIIELKGNTVILRFNPKTSDVLKLPFDVSIICALPRPQTLKKVLILAGTYSVKKLIFISSNRVEKSYFQSPLLKEENYLPYLYEGLSQGKFTRLPEVKFFKYFKKFWQDDYQYEFNNPQNLIIKLIAHPETKETILTTCSQMNTEYTIVIGPEGGWIPFEIELITSLGINPVSLGTPVLRVENAINAALAQLELTSHR